VSATKIFGVAGGTASGKTSLASDIKRLAGDERAQVIPLDAYYLSNSHLPKAERDAFNYDHPDSLEVSLLGGHLEALLRGEAVETPTYDFEAHSRAPATVTVTPSEVLLVEGILALHFPDLRKFFSGSVFVDTPDDLRLARRLLRDVRERGRTAESVLSQWSANVQPMHQAFCAPTKALASVVFSGVEWNDDQVRELLSKLGIDREPS